MNQRFISTRTAFVLISFITLALLIGSSVLGRIVFKAAATDATLYFSRLAVDAKPNTNFSINILADLSSVADVTGVQLEIAYDPDVLLPISAEPSALWKQVLFKVNLGKLSVVFVPRDPKSSIENPVTGLNFGQLTFKSLAVGTTNLTSNPDTTLLAVSSAPGGKGIENVISSVIDTRIRVTDSATDNLSNSPVRVDEATTGSPLEFSSQRIISTSQLLTPSSALILIRLEHPARVSVAFGQNTTLENRAEYSAQSAMAEIRIVGLEPNIRYYYQVIAEDADATNRVLGQVKSFELPKLSSTNTVDRSELTIFPARAAKSATAYAQFFDQENNIVTGLAPRLQTDNPQVSATSFSEVAGLYQAAVNSLETKKQVVHYTLMLNEQVSNNLSALFDPSLDRTEPKSNQSLLAIKLDQKAINLILLLVAGLVGLGLGFYKLARVK